MKVSFCIIAYNEENALPSLLQDVINQNYPHELMEVVLVDGNSTDSTKQVMKDFKEQHHDFYNVKILDNLKRKQASGWNIAIENASGDIIIRIDAHASVPSDFVSKNVACIESGEDICGGQRPNIIDENTPWKETLLLAESSMFGSSIAPYRRNIGKTYVKSMFHAAYKKEVFQKAGLFNESLGRTEDNEMHYRMREAGYKFCFDSNIISYQHTRSNLKKMLKQKYQNGYWVGLTVGVCPKCLSIYHFIPFTFIWSILFSVGMWGVGMPFFAIMLSVIYMSMNIIMAVTAVWDKRFYIQYIMLPVIFLSLHIVYGWGTIMGIIKLPAWLQEQKKRSKLQQGEVK